MPGIIAVISAFVFTLIFNFLVNYYVVGPIIKITERIKKFKENRTSFSVIIETKDELFYLANEIGDLCALVAAKDGKT